MEYHAGESVFSHAGAMKRLSTTHWNAHHAAVKPLKDKFDECMAAIEALCDPGENFDTRSFTCCR